MRHNTTNGGPTSADTTARPRPEQKNGRGRPGRRPGSGYRQQSERIAWLVADYNAYRELERQEHCKLRDLRRGIYNEARSLGLTVEQLRAFCLITQSSGRIAAE
jgi:hypothetical protein